MPVHNWCKAQAEQTAIKTGFCCCSTHVELDDLLLFLPEQQARDAMEAFDGDADGHISAEVPHPSQHPRADADYGHGSMICEE